MKNNYNIFNYKLLFLFLLITFIWVACIPVTQKTVVSKSPSVRILLNEINQKDSISFLGKYKLISEEAEYEFGSQNSKIFISPSPNSLLIYNNFRYLEYQKTKMVKLIALSNTNQFNYKERSYYGDIIFVQSGDSNVQIINELPLEEYLRGVVPAEIYANDLGNMEAVKAQAICARTYAINKIRSTKNVYCTLICAKIKRP